MDKNLGLGNEALEFTFESEPVYRRVYISSGSLELLFDQIIQELRQFNFEIFMISAVDLPHNSVFIDDDDIGKISDEILVRKPA